MPDVSKGVNRRPERIPPWDLIGRERPPESVFEEFRKLHGLTPCDPEDAEAEDAEA